MTDRLHAARKYSYRPLEELNLMDDFLFQQMLAQEGDGEEFCRILLRTILGKTIRKVRITPQKNILGLDTDRHGIRLDAYIEDISDYIPLPDSADNHSNDIADAEIIDTQIMPDIYDIEPNNRYEKKSLPKRMRYYHGLIDAQFLTSDIEYQNLQNVVIIVILPYDPFGQNRMVYTIQNQCVEDPTIPYDDGAKKIFLYTRGTEGNPSQELRDMLKYLEKTNDENVANQDIHTIHCFVEKIKHRKEVGINYMKSWEIERMNREEGRLEGLKEGRLEGLKEGRLEGIEETIKAFIETCQDFGQSKEETISLLLKKFAMPREKAQLLVTRYWQKSRNPL